MGGEESDRDEVDPTRFRADMALDRLVPSLLDSLRRSWSPASWDSGWPRVLARESPSNTALADCQWLGSHAGEELMRQRDGLRIARESMSHVGRR